MPKLPPRPTRLRAVTSRGVLVLDTTTRELAPALRHRNILVVEMDDRTPDAALLAGRIVVTLEPDLYVWDASSWDLGIIALDRLGEPEATAKRVSDAIIKHELWTVRHGFVLEVRRSGRHRFTPLID